MKRCAFLGGILGFAVAILLSLHGGSQPARAASSYLAPPSNSSSVTLSWNWIISNKISAFTASTGTYNVLDTDEFLDSNGEGSNGDPNAPSTLVADMHAANKYAICYMEAGAFQTGFDDNGNFAAADYGLGASKYQMQGYPNEWWFDLRGFSGYQPGGVLTGAAVNIASALEQRIAGCKAEGQDALEPDDLDGYTNNSASGVAGGGWGLTQADAAGFEAWLAYTAHSDGLAIFQKNDGANTAADEPIFDGMIIEECNHYDDPCVGSDGDFVDDYISHGKPVLNAEYTQDGETTAKFCSADANAGMTGALFSVDLDGSSYSSCQTGKGYVYPTSGSTSLTSSSISTSTSPTSTSTSSTTSTPTQTSSSSTSTTVSTSSTSSTQTTTATSTSTSSPSKPSNTKRPMLSGTAKQGDQLKTTTGTWTGSPKFGYAWQRCQASCQVVKNATRSTYNLGSSDVGFQLQAIVTAMNKSGSSSATTGLSAVVTKQRSRGVRAEHGMKR